MIEKEYEQMNSISKKKANIKKQPKVVDTAMKIVSDMQDIFESDRNNNLEKKQAVGKINNVDSVCNRVIHSNLRLDCVKAGILFEIKRWLEPLPDKTLPNAKVKRRLLDLLLTLPEIRKNDLIDSEIGKIVYFYAINTRETKAIRSLAQNVVNKWKANILSEDQ